MWSGAPTAAGRSAPRPLLAAVDAAFNHPAHDRLADVIDALASHLAHDRCTTDTVREPASMRFWG